MMTQKNKFHRRALDFTGTPAGTTIDFDPTTFTPPLDPDGNSIFHFTTITIPTDVTIKFRADKAGAAPIHWLATGAVVIDGTLDLNGEDGRLLNGLRSVSIPGSGGFHVGPRCSLTQFCFRHFLLLQDEL